MEQPVAYDPQRGNWNVYGYSDVQQVLSDYEKFSSRFQGTQNTPGDTVQPFAESMISMDPPRHRQLRSLVSQAFTPRAVDALAPRIREIVDELLDPVAAEGKMDVIEHFGYPLPVTVIAELMGIPVEDRERFKHWSDIVVSAANLGDMSIWEKSGDAIMEMSTYFFNMIEFRREHPGDDLISGLLNVSIEGQHLELPELLGFCALLLVAGNETTTNLIGNAILILTDNPQVWPRLREQPDRLPAAIEEVLRYRSPVQSMYRVSREEVVLSGVRIPANEPIVAWIGSANHDETQFPQAEDYVFDRAPNRHLAFGQGIHYCLGAPLARLEAKIALGEMIKRFSSIERVPDASIERIPSTLIYGLTSLPITFTLA